MDVPTTASDSPAKGVVRVRLRRSLKISGLLLALYVLFVPAMLFYQPLVVWTLAGVLVSCLVSLVMPGLSRTLGLAFLWLVELGVLGLCGDLFLNAAYGVLCVAIIAATWRVVSPARFGKIAATFLVIWLLVSASLYTWPYVFVKFVPFMVIFGGLAVLVLWKAPRDFLTSRLPRVLLSIVVFGVPVAIEATLSQKFSTPSPLQTLVVRLQDSVRVLLPAWKLPGGVRLFAHTDYGRLVVFDEPAIGYKDSIFDNEFFLALLNDDGSLKSKPLPIPTHPIDGFVNLENDPRQWLVPSLMGRNLCAVDIEAWKVLRCSKPDREYNLVVRSPSDQYCATSIDWIYPTFIYETATLNLLGEVPRRDDACAAGSALLFVDETHLVEACDGGGPMYLIEINPVAGAKIVDRLDIQPEPGTVMGMGLMTSTGDLVFAEAVNGRVYVYDLAAKKVKKRRFLSPSLRALERIEARGLWCAVSEWGFVFIFDDELNVKKVLYGGQKIKGVHVAGDKLYFASQAGLLEVDLGDR